MSSGSMWAPANVADTLASPPPRTPRRNGNANYRESDHSPSNGRSASSSAKDSGPGFRGQRGRGRGYRNGPSKYHQSDLLDDSQRDASLAQAGSSKSSAISFESRAEDTAAAASSTLPNAAAERDPRKANLGSKASVWAPKEEESVTPRVITPPTALQVPKPQTIFKASQQSQIDVVGEQVRKLDIDRGTEAPPTSSVTVQSHSLPFEEAPGSARTSNFDTLTTGTSEPSIAGPSTPPPPPRDTAALPLQVPTPSGSVFATPSKYDWADEEEEDLDVHDLAAEWGLSVPGQAGQVSTEKDTSHTSVDEEPTVANPPRTPSLLDRLSPPEETRAATPSRRAKSAKGSRQTSTSSTPSLLDRIAPAEVAKPGGSSLLDRLSPRVEPESVGASPQQGPSISIKGSAAVLNVTSTKAPPVELLPESPPTASIPSISGGKGPELTSPPPPAGPAPTVRAPRRDRPRPEVRSDAFARLSKGLLKGQSK